MTIFGYLLRDASWITSLPLAKEGKNNRDYSDRLPVNAYGDRQLNSVGFAIAVALSAKQQAKHALACLSTPPHRHSPPNYCSGGAVIAFATSENALTTAVAAPPTALAAVLPTVR